MKNIALTLCAALLITAGGQLFAKDSRDNGFAGRWVLDKKRSANLPPGLTDLEQRLKQSGSSMFIESKFPEPANGIAPLVYLGIMTNTLELKTDGSETQNQIGPFQQGSRTTLNGNTMETEWTAIVKGDKVNGHWTRTLSDDGRQTTLQIKEESTQGQHGEAILYFKRK